MVILLAVVACGLAGCGGGSSGSESSADTTTTTKAAAARETGEMASSEQTASSGDCTMLMTVVADLTVGAHANEVVAPFRDITAKDYVRDRDFIAGYLAEAPEAIRADVELLGRWIDHYATGAEAAGVAPGVVPTFEQMIEINGGAYMDSLEQDRLVPAIQALQLWAEGGCSGARPVVPPPPTPAETGTETVAAPTNPLAKAAAEAELGEEVDAVTEVLNEVVHARPADEAELGVATADSELRNCRKVRTMSENALIAPGGWGFSCEVWRDGKLRLEAAPAIIDVDGRIAAAP